MADEKGFFFWEEVRRRTLRMIQKEITHRPCPDFLQLSQERGCKVERGLHGRKLLQPVRHIVVSFGRMETHPGHTSSTRNRVRVIRLVHMPEKTDVGSLHSRMLLRTYAQYVIEVKGMQ